MLRHLLLLILPGIFLAIGLAAPAMARDPVATDFLVTIEAGTMPVLLSAPHGGQVPIPGIPERQGKEVERFVTSRDVNVNKIADLTAKALDKKLRVRPFLVIARFERKFVDANRAPEAAYEHETAKLHYDAYHRAIQDALVKIKQDWGRGLVIDIHGQEKTPDGIYRGTADGESVKQLVKEHGRAAVTGEKSLFGSLAKLGYKVLPGNDEVDQIEKFFNGGHITRTYGSHKLPDVDAIQVEFGTQFRKDAALEKTAQDLATSIETFAAEYLPKQRLAPSK